MVAKPTRALLIRKSEAKQNNSMCFVKLKICELIMYLHSDSTSNIQYKLLAERYCHRLVATYAHSSSILSFSSTDFA